MQQNYAVILKFNKGLSLITVSYYDFFSETLKKALT